LKVGGLIPAEVTKLSTMGTRFSASTRSYNDGQLYIHLMDCLSLLKPCGQERMLDQNSRGVGGSDEGDGINRISK
jgi:hypothetical protein